MRKRKFAEGDLVIPDSDVSPETGPGRAPAKEQSFGAAFRAARNAGDSSFMWKGKKYTTEMAGGAKPAAKPASGRPAPADARPRGQDAGPAAAAAAGRTPSGVPDERKRFAARFGPGEMRTPENAEATIPQEDIDAAKAAGIARRKAQEEGPNPAMETLKKIGAAMGPQDVRDRLKAQGYAAGGSVRGNGCAQRGLTKGKMR